MIKQRGQQVANATLALSYISIEEHSNDGILGQGGDDVIFGAGGDDALYGVLTVSKN
ncbi:MAG: hypothetical protein IJ780_03855 [Neisseriaceae bacterium]|nr:hypothetical protein [Neisseriaceae bacterium]MBR1819247.1 hypothetical protein [Neisseriaceae bacterium]